ncbi:hypothetical protein KBZ21_40265, partial [Streptomyces sp. A73]|nr:hypothetical protein [Streptomyces sp. A73]
WFIDGFTINKSSKRAENRDDAMETHREALYAARTEEPFPPRGMWPDARNRYCTSDQKRGPSRKLITELVAELGIPRVGSRPA